MLFLSFTMKWMLIAQIEQQQLPPPPPPSFLCSVLRNFHRGFASYCFMSYAHRIIQPIECTNEQGINLSCFHQMYIIFTKV